jgi:putative ABC transport system permease protein
MTLAGIAVRNLARNGLRAALTVVGVGVAVLAFLLLQSVTAAWVSGPRSAPRDRVVTRHKVTFAMALPKHYIELVRGSSHVKAATWASWFGGRDPKHDTEFFATLAVDPTSYFSVYDDMKVPRDERDAFEHDKQGAIVGDVLASKLGWRVGEKVVLQSGIVPGEWRFTIDGIYTATSKAIDRSNFILRWDYINDSVPVDRRDMIGWIVSRVDDPTRTAQVSVGIDGLFDDRDIQTLSQDERSVGAHFLAMLSAILDALDAVSAVILVVMTLILGNTVAMAVRERAGEYGVLRAIGFLPRHVAFSVVAESLVLGALGGLLGTALAWPFIDVLVARLVADTMGSFFPSFGLDASQMATGILLPAALGGLASAIPAWTASKRSVIDSIRRVA